MKYFLLVLVLFSLSFSQVLSDVNFVAMISNVPAKYMDSVRVSFSMIDKNGMKFDTVVQYPTYEVNPYTGVKVFGDEYGYSFTKKWTYPVVVYAKVILGSGTRWFRDCDSAVAPKPNMIPGIGRVFQPVFFGFRGGLFENGVECVTGDTIKYTTICDSGIVRSTKESFKKGYLLVTQGFSPDIIDTCHVSILHKGKEYKAFEVIPIGNNSYRCDVYQWLGSSKKLRSFEFQFKDTIINGVDFFIGAATNLIQTPIHAPVKSTSHTSTIYDLRGKKVTITNSTAQNIFINKSTKIIVKEGRYEF